MQEFVLTIRVTANTVETVSPAEISQAIGELLRGYDSGTTTIETCQEV